MTSAWFELLWLKSHLIARAASHDGILNYCTLYDILSIQLRSIDAAKTDEPLRHRGLEWAVGFDKETMNSGIDWHGRFAFSYR